MAHWLNNTPGTEHTQQTHQSHNFFHKQILLKKFHFWLDHPIWGKTSIVHALPFGSLLSGAYTAQS